MGLRLQFGGKVTKALKDRYIQSPNWTGKLFSNLVETSLYIPITAIPKLVYNQFFKKKGRLPLVSLPIKVFDKVAFLAPSQSTKFVWFGHSVVLLRMNGKSILIDPMLGQDASPIAPFKTKRFSQGTLDLIDKLPEIDLVLLTHDHYDHLDLESILKLKGKVKQYWVALGCARHLKAWGVNCVIKEFGWWSSLKFDDIEITFTPTRHFAGRGFTDRNKSLWGGWVLKTSTENIYFSGDSGYGDHFKMVGEKLGPFDFGFMECGQYHKLWHPIHMFPSESVQAGIDAGVKKMMPVHWGGFALALHHWKTPVDTFVKAATSKDVRYLTPELGELVNVNENRSSNWWSNYN